MNRLCTATRGIASWRERLIDPERQWKRGFSALETAVAWEAASRGPSGVPDQIADLFRHDPAYGVPTLLLAIAEHKVRLPGGNADSQSDVWALLDTKAGKVSLSIEAKANEPFGVGHQSLAAWLTAGTSDRSEQNRRERWEHIRSYLPSAESDTYAPVAYQLLHRCAAAVIEARRFGLDHATFLVQAFGSPPESFDAFAMLCRAIGIGVERGRLLPSSAGDVRLVVGWVDCPVASDAQIAAVA